MEWLVVILLVALIVLTTLSLVRREGGGVSGADMAAVQVEAARREGELREALARAEASRASDQQQLAAFGAVSQQALAGQSQQFLQLAETRYGALANGTSTLLNQHSERIAAALDALGARLSSLERERSQATNSLESMVRELTQATQATRSEAARLHSALRDSRVRGTWGEVQLRRVLELAGLERHTDFVEQQSSVADGQTIRPDVVVGLPNGRSIVIDAKVPLDRYLEAANSDDPDAERQLLVEHARSLAGHVNALSNRNYTSGVDGAIDLVVLFLPGDAFLTAALDADPSLFETSATKGVVLTTPSSLLPLLRGIALGWRERRAEEEAAEIQRLGAELHERIANFLDGYAAVGARLNSAVESYNRSVGSVEGRMLVTARKLAEVGAGSTKKVPEMATVAALARTPTVPVLASGGSGGGDPDAEPGGELSLPSGE